MRQKRVWLSDNKSVLTGAIDNQPYHEYIAGQGINALTGQKSASALYPFRIDSFPPYTYDFESSIVGSEDEYTTLFDLEVGAGGYNTDGLYLSGSAKFLYDVKYTYISLSVVVKAPLQSNGPGNPSDRYLLTTEALEVLEKDPNKFREVYGDYFVATWRGGSRLVAVYNCVSTDRDRLAEFRGELFADALDLFNLEAVAKFKDTSKQYNVNYKCSVHMEGIRGIPPAFDGKLETVVKLSEWFHESDADGKPKNLSPVPSRVDFLHYTNVDSRALMELPVDPAVFGEIQAIRYYIGNAATTINDLPSYYKNLKDPNTGDPYKLVVEKLQTSFTSQQKTLPTDNKARKALLTESKRVSEILALAEGKVAFYDAFIAAHFQDRGMSSWPTQSLGLTTQARPGSLIEIRSESSRWQHDWKIGTWETLVSFNHPEAICVGYLISNNWNDSTNGTWRVEGAGIIGQSVGSVHLEGQYDRGVDWSVTFYYVDRSNFPWISAESE